LKAQQIQLNKKEDKLERMTADEVKNELKDKGLPTYGTNGEKLDRLKKYHGITPAGVNQSVDVIQNDEVRIVAPAKPPKNIPKDDVVNKIELINQKREERRANLQKLKEDKSKKNEENKAKGINCDVDFEGMIQKHRFKEHMLHNHVEASKVR